MNLYDDSESETIAMDCTPPELREDAKLVMNNLLPPKSKEKYMKMYQTFMDWRDKKGANTFSENVFVAYFSELAKVKKPSTLWATYSMLKATVQLNHGVDIKQYSNLTSMLKRQSDGFKSKKSKIFTSANIEKFINEAPDDKYLVTKVALIMGLNGACRCIELTTITTDNIENHNNMMLVKLCDTKTKIDRMFVVRDDFLTIVRKYEALRPVNTNCNRFFLNYKDGKCTRQPIGRHKIALMPKQIATFLDLPDVESYTGHCFRRSSATLLADSGANLTTLKRHGGWRSDKVAEGYIENSVENKSEITSKINQNIKVKLLDPQPPCRPPLRPLSPQPSTSHQLFQESSPVEPLQPPSPQPTISHHNISQTSTLSEIQQTTIKVPGKTIKLSFNNCPNMTNVTFNIN